MGIRSVSRQEAVERGLEPPDGHLNGTFMEFTCERDHCTPEERAVIDAACIMVQWENCSPVHDDIDQTLSLRLRFEDAVTALLTTRKEQG